MPSRERPRRREPDSATPRGTRAAARDGEEDTMGSKTAATVMAFAVTIGAHAARPGTVHAQETCAAGVAFSGAATGAGTALELHGGALYAVGYDSAPGNGQWRVEKRGAGDCALAAPFGSGGVVQVTPPSIGTCRAPSRPTRRRCISPEATAPTARDTTAGASRSAPQPTVPWSPRSADAASSPATPVRRARSHSAAGLSGPPATPRSSGGSRSAMP